MANWIIGGGIFALVAFIIIRMIKRARSGKGACECSGCDACSGCGTHNHDEKA